MTFRNLPIHVYDAVAQASEAPSLAIEPPGRRLRGLFAFLMMVAMVVAAAGAIAWLLL